VQTGIARCGAWFAHQLPGTGLGDGVLPDVVTVAKGLGGGIPVGAAVALGERAGALLGPGQHGTTFGGNPVAAAAGLAVLRTVEAEGLAERSAVLGEHLAAAVRGLGNPLVADVRGLGLLRAVVLTEPVAAGVVAAGLAAGFIVNAVAPDAVRLAPPLVVTQAQLDELVAALPGLLDAATTAERKA
jgi:acetylornithine aminotransferase